MATERRAGSPGFTLLEIMVALAIVGGLLVSLLSSINYNLGIAARHEFVTVSSVLARDKLIETEKNPVNGEGTFPAPHAEYRFRTEIRKYPFPGISEIVVTVSRGQKEETRFSGLVETKR